jgi:hypothetical protein
MKSFVVSFAIVLGSMTGPAQGFAQAGTHALNLHTLRASANCPVGLTAKRGIGYGGTLAIDGGQRKRFGQELQIRLTNWKSAEVAGIRITVHGFAGKVGLLSTNAVQADSPNSNKADPLEAKKTLDVQMTIGANKEFSTNLWLSGFTAISLIDINSVNYADGSTWHASAQETCHFAPEGTILISSVE